MLVSVSVCQCGGIVENDRWRAVLRFIGEYVRREGFAPTIQEIADGVGLKSKSSVEHHLVHLEEMGLIARKARAPRTIRITIPRGNVVLEWKLQDGLYNEEAFREILDRGPVQL